jgi:hypothetical protein
MRRLILLAGLALVWGLSQGRGQQPERNSSDKEDKGTYLGVLFCSVPEVLYDQMPDLPRGQGVVVTHVLPDSPAAKAGLLRHDLVLQYDAEKIRDCDHFARLIQADKPDRKVKLSLLRGGRAKSIEVTLSLGPVLRIASEGKSSTDAEGGEAVVKALAKPNGPPTVTVAATPIGDGTVKVTFEYYQEGSARLNSLTCTGTPDDIEGEIRKLPSRLQSLAKAAVQRIRDLELQKAAQVQTPPTTVNR